MTTCGHNPYDGWLNGKGVLSGEVRVPSNNLEHYEPMLADVTRAIARRPFGFKTPTGLPVAPSDLARILEIQDEAKLYACWCFFQVAAAVEAVLGPPDEALVVEQTNAPARLRQTVLRWAGATLTYDRTCTGGAAAGSSSPDLRPDMLLEVGGARYMLDAKYQLTNVAWVGGKLVYAEATWKPEDVVRMRTYKAAIAGVRAAVVLYPGPAGSLTFFLDEEGGPWDGVGAIALRPGASTADQLVAWLRRPLGASPASCRAHPGGRL